MAETNGRKLAPPLDLMKAASLFLDFDGTIVPIVARPDYVQVSARVHRVLDLLSLRMKGRVALVSGRTAHEVRQLLNNPPFPIAGCHGLEMLWPDGRCVAPPVPDFLAVVTSELQKIRTYYPAILVEPKPYGAALHYRQAPQAEAACRFLVVDLASRFGLGLQAGKMVFELRIAGADKGTAVTTLLAEPPMSGSAPIFIGDDQTDEAGFAAAARLGGAGILVGPERPSAARFRLDDVDATLDWLEQTPEAT